MISNGSLLSALRSLGYRFKRQAKRVAIWEKPGGVDRLTISLRKSHDRSYAATVLRMAGASDEMIQKVIDGE